MKSIRIFGVGGLLVGLLATLLHIAPSYAAPARLPAGQAQSVEIKLTASDAASRDHFGYTVALDGDTAIVAAPIKNDDTQTWMGAAYVFVRSESGWAEQAKLAMPDDYNSAMFGYSIALEGNTALIGAYQSGAVYVFVRNGSIWSLQQKLTGSNPFGDSFGAALALDGNVALVGAPGADTSAGWDAGVVYVFRRNGTTWSEQTRLIAADTARGSYFGSAIALEGNMAIVGALANTTTAGEYAGAAYVFARSGNSWTQRQKLSPLDSAADDYFGSAVALQGDTAIIGAHSDDTEAGVNTGAAYVFTKSGDVWTQQQVLTAADASPHDALGQTVALDGDTLLLTIPNDETEAGRGAGSVLVFSRSGGSWVQVRQLTASDGAQDDYFGQAVALSGDRMLVGAPYNDGPTTRSSGAAYMYEPQPPPPSCQGKPATIVGTDAGETLTGTEGDDVILGLGGDDTIDGMGGDDTICAGDGADAVYGGAGGDSILGEAGADVLWGGVGLNADPIADGDDRIDGGADGDKLYGEDGVDTLFGQDGSDRLYGQSGNDTVEGGDHDDILQGGAGDDTLKGGAGADTLTGSLGRDFFSGGPDEDTLTDFRPSQGDTRDGT